MLDFLIKLLDLCILPFKITDNIIVMIPAISCAVLGVTGMVKTLIVKG